MKNSRYHNTPQILTRFPRVILQAFLCFTLILVAAPAMADPAGAAAVVGMAGTILPLASMGAMLVRDLVARRVEVLKEVEALESRDDLDDEAETRFAGLIEEIKNIDETVKTKQERRANRSAARQSIGAAPVAPIRGPDPSTEQENRNDIVENPPTEYRLMRAIQLRMQGKEVDGLEGEISQEIAHRTGKMPQSVFVPTSLMVERRDLDVSAGTGAQQTGTATSMIAMLRNRAQVVGLGATLMSDMVGTFDLPKQTGSATAQWVTEGNAASETAGSIGQVAFAPSTLSTWTDYTRKLVMQTGLDAEQFVRADLMAVAALELDRTVINGSGSGEEPEGILQNSSIPTVALGTNGAAPTRASMIALETEVSQDNADGTTMGYLTNSKMRGKLKNTLTDAGSGLFVWGEGMGGGDFVNGYRAAVSNQVPSTLTKGSSGAVCSAAIFGDWASVIIAFWSGMDLLVDPFTGGNAGTVRVSLLQDADVQFRHEESFAKIVDALTT